jgi:hypothetical protein
MLPTVTEYRLQKPLLEEKARQVSLQGQGFRTPSSVLFLTSIKNVDLIHCNSTGRGVTLHKAFSITLILGFRSLSA